MTDKNNQISLKCDLALSLIFFSRQPLFLWPTHKFTFLYSLQNWLFQWSFLKHLRNLLGCSFELSDALICCIFKQILSESQPRSDNIRPTEQSHLQLRCFTQSVLSNRLKTRPFCCPKQSCFWAVFQRQQDRMDQDRQKSN